MNKPELRQLVRQRKQAMSREEILGKSRALAELLYGTSQYRQARTIYCYASFNQEVCTGPIMIHALRDGKTVAVPRMTEYGLRFIQIDTPESLRPGRMGIPEPPADGTPLDDPSALVLVPGLAFDIKGNRLGYGGGWYDRFLKAEPAHPTVALCYDFQLFEQLPADDYDVPVQLVLWA